MRVLAGARTSGLTGHGVAFVSRKEQRVLELEGMSRQRPILRLLLAQAVVPAECSLRLVSKGVECPTPSTPFLTHFFFKLSLNGI